MPIVQGHPLEGGSSILRRIADRMCDPDSCVTGMDVTPEKTPDGGNLTTIRIYAKPGAEPLAPPRAAAPLDPTDVARWRVLAQKARDFGDDEDEAYRALGLLLAEVERLQALITSSELPWLRAVAAEPEPGPEVFADVERMRMRPLPERIAEWKRVLEQPTSKAGALRLLLGFPGLLAEVERLAAPADTERMSLVGDDGEVASAVRAKRPEDDRLREENGRLRSLLREAEWSATECDSNPQCPVCGGLKPNHEPDCRLAAAIQGQALPSEADRLRSLLREVDGALRVYQEGDDVISPEALASLRARLAAELKP